MKKIKIARRSFDEPWNCAQPWPEDCAVQCGGEGVVLAKDTFAGMFHDTGKAARAINAVAGGILPPKSYRTAFFEAFPRIPSCFIRGEGETIKEAEKEAWNPQAWRVGSRA